MKKIYSLLLFVAIAAHGFSQTAATYGFTAIAGTYSSISTAPGVVTSSLACNDCNATGIPVGFTFRFCGTNYTALAASSNGFLSLANLSPAPLSPVASNITGAGFLMPFWADLTGVPGAFTPAAYYLTTGTAPNRVFTFEWKNYFSYGTSNSGNFQVKLYESSNIIEFVYGTFTGSVINPSAIGIANSTTDWQTLPDATTALAPSSTTFTNSLATMVTSGQVYRWTPPCSGTPPAGTVTASLTAGCVSYTSLLTLTGGTPPTVPGTTYLWKYSPNGTSWTAIAGATNPTYTATVTATVYYHCITYCSYSGLTNVTPPVILYFNQPGAISGPDTICAGATGMFSDTTLGGIWSSSNTAVATIGAVGGVMGVSQGSTTISFTHGGCTATRPLYVSAAPAAGSITGRYLICIAPTTFTESVSGGIWGVTNTSIAGVSTIGAVFGILPGRDTVTYTVTNSCGSSVAKYAINTTPCLTGVNNTNPSEINIELYPNPNTGAFTFKATAQNDEPVSVTITSLLGTQLKQFTTTTNKTTDLNTSLPPGMYVLAVQSKQGSAVTKMMVE
jgi:Secretion system C-terminal sorting domain